MGLPHPLFNDDAAATTSYLQGRVGSPFVPRIDRVRQYFDDLIARIDGWRPDDLHARVRAHNLYTIYVYLVLLWATAMRPCGDPLITRDALRGPRGWFIIADKNNRIFWERRPVPVCALVWELLLALEQGTEAFCRWLGSQGYPVAVDDQILFVIVRGATGKALTPHRARTVLEAEGLRYCWKFNAARHFWVSSWLELERPLSRIESFLGHVHEGMEPWGPFSLASLPQRGEEFRARSEEILELIGVRMLVHPCQEERA